MVVLLYALVGGVVAGLGSLIVWAAGKKFGWSAKRKRFGGLIAVAVAIAAVRLVPIDRVALLIQSPDSLQAQADAALTQVAAFRVLHDYYPSDYAIMRDAAVEGLKAGETNVQIINSVRPRLLATYTAQMMKASDATLARQIAFIVKQTNFLQDVNPQYCHELMNTPGKLSFNPAAVFPAEMNQEELALMADVLRETADIPVVNPVPLGEEEIGPIAERSFKRLSTSDADALQVINFEPAQATTPAQKTAGCHFALGLMEEINSLPVADRARTFRGLLAEGQAPRS